MPKQWVRGGDVVDDLPTHVGVNRTASRNGCPSLRRPHARGSEPDKLLDKIAESRSVHPLAFLLDEPYRTLFVRSSLSPDMTLSAFAGKKVDPRYNRLFHDRAIGRYRHDDVL